MRLLARHAIAPLRTIEQKIADAGPYNQRIDPHLITEAKKELLAAGAILQKLVNNVPWFYLPSTPKETLEARTTELALIHAALAQTSFGKRAGQTLEIAVYRSLLDQERLRPFGHFSNLDVHPDDQLYIKTQPPSRIGRNSIEPSSLDFIVFLPDDGMAGIEVKNIRQWIYPNRSEVKDLLWKSYELELVPVLIARRIHYSTFSALNHCGLLIHQTYNQRYPASDEELANRAKHKDLLGYHDIRTGNTPDDRLNKFLHEHLPRLMPEAKDRFNDYKDLIGAYVSGEMDYQEFAGRAKRRLRGEPEGGFPEDTYPDD